MTGIAMRSGFDWSAVRWEGPDEMPGTSCSYCGRPTGEDGVVMWKADGSAARFCDRCVERWVTTA